MGAFDNNSNSSSDSPALGDLVTITKGQTENIGQLAAWAIAPGQTLSSTASPKATVISALGTSSVLAIAASTTRRGIEFHSSDPVGNSYIWLMPGASAVAQQGIVLVPGSRYRVPNTLAANAGFSAIASTGSANKLTVIEFF